MKNRSGFVLMWLAVSFIVAGSVMATDSFPILRSGECNYIGQSYSVYDSVISFDSSYYIPRPRYEFGDRTPSQFDTDEIRCSVVKHLHPWLNSEDSSAYRDIRFYSTTIKLRAYWEFPNDTSNVLLRFDSETGTAKIAYFVFNRNTKKVYPLLDQFAEVTRQYNAFLQENPKAFGLTPLCQTLLLLKLRYIGTPVFVVRVPDEIAVANIGYNELSMRDDSNRDWLSCEDIKQDTLLNNAYRAARKVKRGKEHEKELMAALAEVPHSIYSPLTTVNGDTITTKLTVYNAFAGELAWWESVILTNGKMLNLRNLRPPALSFDFCLDYDRWIHEDRSPYYRTYSTLSEKVNRRPDSLVPLKGCGTGPRIFWRFEHASVSLSLKDMIDTLRADYRFFTRGGEDFYLPALISMMSDSLTAGNNVSFDYDTMIYPLNPGLDHAIASFLESGTTEVLESASGKDVDWIRQYDYSGESLEHYGARRFYLPSNKIIIDVVKWIS